MKDYYLSVLQDFENFLRTSKLGARDIVFISQKYNSIFTTYDIPPNIYQVFDEDDALESLINADVSPDITTRKIKIENKYSFTV